MGGYRLGIKERMKFLLESALLLLFVLVLPTVKGHCCGHCIPALCSCYQTTGGCDTLTADGDCDPPPNSHLCCAPKAAGDCNLFCCECSSCCSRADGGSNSIPALQKWKEMDRNQDFKLDQEEIAYYLESVDSNSNGVIEPWEVDSSLYNIR